MFNPVWPFSLLTMLFSYFHSFSHVLQQYNAKESSNIRMLFAIKYQGFIQAVLLMSVFRSKIEFLNVVKCSRESLGALSSATDS